MNAFALKLLCIRANGYALVSRDHLMKFFFFPHWFATSPTCFIKTHKSTTDLIFTSEGCFKKNKKVTETGISDFHCLISTFLRSQFCQLKPEKFLQISKILMRKFLNPFQANVPKPGGWFLLATCVKNTCGRVTF